MDTHRQSLIPAFLTEQLERAANRALYYAPVTRLQLTKLKGKRKLVVAHRSNDQGRAKPHTSFPLNQYALLQPPRRGY